MIPLGKGRLKRGDTFSFCVQVVDDGDTPISGIASKLRAQVRKEDDTLISELEISETETAGVYLFRHEGSTQSWPLDKLIVDWEYRDNDIITSSDTFYITVVRDVTHD